MFGPCKGSYLGYLPTATKDHPGALDRRSVDPKGRPTPRWFEQTQQGCHRLSTPLQIPPTHLYYNIQVSAPFIRYLITRSSEGSKKKLVVRQVVGVRVESISTKNPEVVFGV